MLSKNKKIIVYSLAVGLLIFGIFLSFYQGKNASESKIGTNNLFTILDDKAKLVSQEPVALYPAVRQQFGNKIKEIQDSLAKGGNNDYLIANYNNLAVYYNYLGNYSASYDNYLKAIALNAKNRVSWLGLGDTLLKMKAYQSAIAAYSKAIGLNKYDSLNYIKLISVYKIMGDKKIIDEAYRQGLALTEKNIDGNTLLMNDYAEWLASIKAYDQAIKEYEDLEKKQPTNKDAINRTIEQINKMKSEVKSQK